MPPEDRNPWELQTLSNRACVVATRLSSSQSMTAPRYTLKTRLPSGHNNSIIALQFSPDGKFLASGSGDGVLMVFSTSTWKPVKRYVDASSLTAVIWHPTFPKTLICGYRSGDIDDCNKVWTDKMGGSIHCIASDKTGTRVALSYGSDVAVVEQHTISVWTNANNLPEPPSLPGLDEELPEPTACSLHFIEGGRLLVVSYVDHGIVCWDVDSMEIKWQITPRTCNIASSAVSPDEKVVVVANLYDGLDWYRIPDRVFSRSFHLRISQNVPIPVLLVDEGKILLVGGTSGDAMIIDAYTAETIQTLDHNPDDYVQALAFCFVEETGTRQIATGTSQSIIQIWTLEAEKSTSPKRRQRVRTPSILAYFVIY
ncbi:WD40-repeat-containing domain protein [Thelephora terrestris]|uniref:WD40-repeat-containing domain protein n=1 Tax=Thelephora terrestris TaxID=56493 RepID=A0A9P6L5A1_9AGAM|nr:WD40-repeat-containing domain protein [Thelephora terrestris]